jgi:Trypsin
VLGGFLPATIASCAGERNVCGVDGTGEQRSSIVGGTSVNDYLAAGDQLQRAIVQIAVRISGEETFVCSGVELPGDYFLTAAHCLADVAPQQVRVRYGNGSKGPFREGTELQRHPSLDIALIVPASRDATSSRGLQCSRSLDDSWKGRRAVLGGYGNTGSGAVQQLLFATEEVSEVDTTRIITLGHGLSGACEGDSGGPLLARDQTGAVTVLGILSSGSAACRGEDNYIRADLAYEWIGKMTGQTPTAPLQCGEITSEGRCYDATVIRCIDGLLRSQSCSQQETCGWDAGTASYGCVPREYPCRGDAFGACEGDRAVACAQGKVMKQTCKDCQRCGFSPNSGEARCMDRD